MDLEPVARHAGRIRERRDPLDEIRELDAGRLGGHGELALLLQVAARVDLDDVDVAGLGEAQVDAAVVADADGAVGLDGGLLELGAQLVRKVGHHRLRPLVLGAVLLPFGLGAQDARLALGKAGEVHLDRRQGERLPVAENADVQLAPFDVLLDEGTVLDFLVNRDHPFH